MKARVVIPTVAGELVSYDIAAHGSATNGHELRLVFATDEAPFERWLFCLLREIGAHVVTDEPDAFRHKLSLGGDEPGVIDEHDVEVPLQTRHPATA